MANTDAVWKQIPLFESLPDKQGKALPLQRVRDKTNPGDVSSAKPATARAKVER